LKKEKLLPEEIYYAVQLEKLNEVRAKLSDIGQA